MTTRHSKLLSNLTFFLLSLTILAGCNQPTPQPSTPPIPPETNKSIASEKITPAAELSQAELINLMLDLEDNFKLQDVLADQTGNTITIRFKAPTISGEDLNNGLAQIFSYLNEKLPTQISVLNLVFMVQNVDSLVINVNRSDINNWKDGKISNTDFLKKFKKTSLL